MGPTWLRRGLLELHGLPSSLRRVPTTLGSIWPTYLISCFSLIFNVFSMFLFDFSGPRGGLEGILELLEATWELLDPLGGILDAMIALLKASWPLLDAS